MRAFARTFLIAATLISLAGMAGAADIRMLSIDATQDAVRALAAEFQKEAGHQVVLTVGSPAEAMQKVKAGEIFDALIASEAAMDALDGEGIVNPESRVPRAGTGLGAARTSYEGALMSDGSVPQAARAFIRFLASPEARAAWLAAKLEPAAER
jgi:ABC-type molybdate transport system substrate-binding protein